MKRAAVFVALLFFVLGVALANAPAQEPPLDLGADTPLKAACDHLVPIGIENGLQVKNCRRYGTDVIDGNTALVTVTIATDHGHFILETHLHKSLWSVSTFTQR